MPRYLNLYLSNETDANLRALMERWGMGEREQGRAIALALELALKSKK